MAYRDMKAGALRGILPGQTIRRCKNGQVASVTAGDVVVLDFLDTGASVDSFTPGDEDSIFGSFAQTETNLLTHGIFGVAQETIAAGENGLVMFEGQTQVLFAGGGATGAPGARATPTNAADGLTVGSGSKVVAILMETRATTAAGLTLCEFLGIHSFR